MPNELIPVFSCLAGLYDVKIVNNWLVVNMFCRSDLEEEPIIRVVQAYEQLLTRLQTPLIEVKG